MAWLCVGARRCGPVPHKHRNLRNPCTLILFQVAHAGSHPYAASVGKREVAMRLSLPLRQAVKPLCSIAQRRTQYTQNEPNCCNAYCPTFFIYRDPFR
jgi:hypothetical protein